MAIRIPWDKYEVAILISFCEKVNQSIISRKKAITHVSTLLRKLAISRKYKIDDIFRNENGISMQFSVANSLITNTECGLTVAKVFKDISELYLYDKDSFDAILNDAYKMLDITKNEGVSMTNVKSVEFNEWLCRCESSHDSACTMTTLRSLNLLLRKNKVIDVPLLKVKEIDEIQGILDIVKENRIVSIPSKKQHISFIKALELYLSYLSESGESNSVDYSHIYGEQLDLYGNSVNISSPKYTNSDFTIWLSEKHHLADTTCKSYASAINNCEQFAKLHGIGNIKLYGNSNYSSVQQAINLLFANHEFCLSNSEQHNRLRAATNKYLEYMGDDNGMCSEEYVPSFSSSVKHILSEKYKYGFRINSSIEIMRFRNFAETENILLPENDDDLKKEIQSVSIEIDGKMHVISDDLLNGLYVIVNKIITDGVQVIFYESLLKYNSEWMESNHITSEEMLKSILSICCKDFYFAKNFMALSDDKIPESIAAMMEFRRIWTDGPLMSINNIIEMLPYIPSEKISWFLSVNNDIIWSSEGTYLLLDRFVLSDEQSDVIYKHIKNTCEKSGYAPITDIVIDDIQEDNYELSKHAIYNAIYSCVLRDDFVLKGKLVTFKGKEIDVVALLKNYCSDKDECTFEEVSEYIKDIIGDVDRRHVFTALYESMIRVDVDRYVADKHVRFDVDEIDSLLERSVSGSFVSIKNVTTFAMFPLCGQSWNHYLLESYCYRFSHIYKLNVININNKNVGIISEKNCEFDYNDMLLKIIEKSAIELTSDAVGRFLVDNGYLTKRKGALVDEITQKAILIREGK